MLQITLAYTTIIMLAYRFNLIINSSIKGIYIMTMTAPKANKYSYVKVIQGNFGYGWEDVCEYNKQEFATVKNDLKEYRLSNTGSYRVIDRRILNK